MAALWVEDDDDPEFDEGDVCHHGVPFCDPCEDCEEEDANDGEALTKLEPTNEP